MEISNITDPRYLSDAPKEPEVCGLCEQEEAYDYWLTTIGRKYVCVTCLDYNLKNDTHILIDLLK